MKKKVLHPSERIVFGKQRLPQNTRGNSKSFSRTEIANEASNYLNNFPQYIEDNNSFGGGDFGGGGSGGEY